MTGTTIPTGVGHTGSAGIAATSFADILPAPASARPAAGVTYALMRHARIHTTAGSAPAEAIGHHLAGILRRSTGFPLPVVPAPSGAPAGGVWLLLTGAPAVVGDEGYVLDVTANAVVIRARRPAGLFAGVQTLRQLLPARVESPTVEPGPWRVPGGRIVDHPRFAYRGAMLDVARHFFTVAEVKRYVDHLCHYKLNHLHLHLTDDQGWRIMIDSWPRLATYGGSTAVGGDPGGHYTQSQYAEIVSYAAQRYVTVVPEIDLPGHVTAALASYPELNPDGVAPPLYTGIDVGFSSLGVGMDITYRFVDDVMRELAAITPGDVVHIGGDEAHATPPPAYATFMSRAQRIVASHGKRTRAWHQILDADVQPSTQAQYWGTTDSNPAVAAAGRAGTGLVLSPAHRAYLDMKYTNETALGVTWAGLTEVREAYDWDPLTAVRDVPERAVQGVEAPLWTESVRTMAEVEFMAFPRLPAIAEIGWSPAATHDWAAFRGRLGAHGSRWRAMGIDFYASPQVSWR